MLKLDRRLAPAVIASLALGLAACGSSNDNSSSSSTGTDTGTTSTASTPGSTPATTGGKEGGSITVLTGTAPDYFDPQEAYTTQGTEISVPTWTSMVTYKHAEGAEGTELIPGLATALPTASSDGKSYSMTLRKGLKYSDGTPAKASDFKHTVERAIKLNWGGKSFLTGYIVGAADYDAGKAKDISGITADDASGKITVKLTQAYGAFPNVLAFPELGLTPSKTPMKYDPTNPPPGIGPYILTDVNPSTSYTLKKNPDFASFNIPDIPTGHLDTINFKIQSNTQTEAQQVLDNQADVFDGGDTVPGALLQQIKSDASDRFKEIPIPSTFYMFLNSKKPPFNNAMARQAVNVGIDRTGFARLAAGAMLPACYFIPEGMIGHPSGDCKFGDLQGADIAKAKQLVQQSGQADTPITVWGERREPRTEYVDYYTSELKKIGFTHVTEKIINDETYFPTIGNQKTDPQTGFADWVQDFPNPSDFYLLLSKAGIQPVNNENYGLVDDPHIESELKFLNAAPATDLKKNEARWQALDEYAASKAYTYVYGTETQPKFYSNKIDFDSAVYLGLGWNDYTTFQLK